MQLKRPESWRGVALVAITYVYFLIFAQFGFLKRLAGLGIEGNGLKAVMGAMAAGGILASLLAPRIGRGSSAYRRLQIAFFGCALAAGLAVAPLNFSESLTVSFLIGSALGLLTVTLVTHLRLWIGGTRPLLKIGLGTGIGYLACNFPQLFDAPARTQAIVAAGACVLGIAIANRTQAQLPDEVPPAIRTGTPPFLLVLACFTALVWLDSAAFSIIQSTAALKEVTWKGTLHLWLNGGLHFIAAMGSAWLLGRRGLTATLAGAFGFLACACWLLADPAHAALASGFYPVGVSLYSVALVAYPSFLAPAATLAERARMAGWIYAIAGWIGSALGIGMAQNLGHIPLAFVLGATALFLFPWLWPLPLAEESAFRSSPVSGSLALTWTPGKIRPEESFTVPLKINVSFLYERIPLSHGFCDGVLSERVNFRLLSRACFHGIGWCRIQRFSCFACDESIPNTRGGE